MKKTISDTEEKDILESYERGEWWTVKNQKHEIIKLREYAKNTLQKDKRINYPDVIQGSGSGTGHCRSRGHFLPNTHIMLSLNRYTICS